MTDHVPGPWTLRQSGEANHHTIDNPSARWLAVIQQNGELSSAQQEANARLMAAAPDLLDALIKTVDYIYSLDKIPCISKAMETIGTARSAITKAGWRDRSQP